MRKTLLLDYLCICTLSILCRSTSCLTQTENPITRSSGGQISGKEDRVIELKQNEARLHDETNHTMQRRQVIDKPTSDNNVRQVRRKRELRDTSNPANRAGLSSGELRVKKSNHAMDQTFVKSISTRNNVKLNSMGNQRDLTNQDKRDLRKQRGTASRLSASNDENKSKSKLREEKRSSYSSEDTKSMEPKSRAIKASDLKSQTPFSEDKLAVDDELKTTAVENGANQKNSESDNEEADDEDDLDEKSAEYEETGEEDDAENDPEVSPTGEESEKLDFTRGVEENDNSGNQEIAKRETDAAEEEYENVEDQDGVCENVNEADESSEQQAKISPKAGLLGRQEKDESRVKRHNADTRAGNGFETNEAVKLSEEHLEDVKEDPDNSSKRDTAPVSSESNLQPETENSKRQVAVENKDKTEANDQEETLVKNSDETANASSKRDAELQDGQTDSNGKNNTDGKSDTRLNRETKTSEDVKPEVKVSPETKADVEENGGSLGEGVGGKENELDSDDEKKLEQQIQQKIDSLKEEIKREVEEKQRVQEIEENNAKYDEMQNEIEEEEDEDNQGSDISNERKTISKRSIIEGIRDPGLKSNRRILRRVKRSSTTDARQLRAIEGVEKLDPNVMINAQLRHESIRKRSAPIYGAADKDVPEISKPLIDRDFTPRRIYLVNKEKKRELTRGRREARNSMIIPEQAHVNIEDEVPPGLSLDPSLLADSSSQSNYRSKRSSSGFTRRRRASAIVPEGRVAFLGYRPQDDDENDEGSEFDDDGFEDRTSNLQQEKSYAVPNDQYQADEYRDENPANFLFASSENDRNDYLVRRKRAGSKDYDQTVSLHGGGTAARRQARTKAEQLQIAKMNSKIKLNHRDKRQTENAIRNRKANSVASLVESSQELSPRLATEYREAFGGLQSDPGGGFARYKRVKRSALRRSLV